MTVVLHHVDSLISLCWREGYGLGDTVLKIKRRTGQAIARDAVRQRFVELAEREVVT